MALTPIEQIVNYIAHQPSPASISLTDDAWDSLTITAVALGLAPLLHWALQNQTIKPPPLALAKLGATRNAHAKRNEEIATQLAEILAACYKNSIKVVVLKGALLAPLLYADPALRPMNDIDLLFQPDDLPVVAQILDNLGYHGKHKSADQGPGVTKHLSTYQRSGNTAQTPNPYLSPQADRMIEPHQSLEESWFGLKVDITPGVWERLVPVTLHQHPAYRLSNEDMLLHLTAHATFHVIMGTTVFVQLYDIARLLTVWGSKLDWLNVLELTDKAQATPFVYAGLYWAKMLYNATPPDLPLETLAKQCPPNLVQYIHQQHASEILERTQQPPLITLTQRLKRGFVDRAETARWATSFGQKLKVWQTALAFYKTDTAHILRHGDS